MFKHGLALSNYNFKYFVVLSSRTFFYNNVNVNVFDICEKITKTNGISYNELNKNGQHWKRILKTNLSEYLKNNNLKFMQGPHEGLVLDKKICHHVMDFLNNNKSIKNNLFCYDSCVEEFSFQSIALIYGEYININSWIDTSTMKKNNSKLEFPENKYVYKLKRV
jgi:hypothetical protein